MTELVKNGDFSKGNKGFGSDYAHVDGAPGSQENVYPSYDIDHSPANAANSAGDWSTFGDHTTGDGKMMVVNGGAGNVWSESIELDAGKHYTFDLWARCALNGSNGLGNLAQLQFFADGTAIGTSLTVQGPDSAGWQELKFRFTPTTTTSVVSIQDATHDQAYNDFCLDDISITRGKHGGGSAASLATLHPGAFAAAHLDLHPAFAPALHGSDHLAIA